MTATDSSQTAAEARSPGLSYQDLLDADTHPVPDVLRLESPRYFGSDDIPIERYTTREWHRREVDHLWSKVWQFACREEHIPVAGDYIVYDIAELSFLVVRQHDGSIKAYPNACLHRGRQLKEYDGRCSELRCAFHGFAWKLDGQLAGRPGRLGLPARRPASRRLHAARVQRRHLGRIRVHQPRPERRSARRAPRRHRRAVRGVGPREPLRRGARVSDHPGELEDRAGGVLRGVPRERDTPADPDVPRRRQHPGRRVGSLLAGDHTGRHAEPAAG